MISESYREQNRLLHETVPLFGAVSARWLNRAEDACKAAQTRNVLDYGCGKGSLVKTLEGLGYDAHGYDPAIPEYSARPQPADVVICTDVLEHIEPEHLEAVLDDLRGLTKTLIFLIVSTRMAKKTLPDGRNAHLIVRDQRYWLEDLMKRFRLIKFHSADSGFEALME